MLEPPKGLRPGMSGKPPKFRRLPNFRLQVLRLRSQPGAISTATAPLASIVASSSGMRPESVSVEPAWPVMKPRRQPNASVKRPF